MALTPISQLIRIKPRPETTLQLVNAIKDPEGTISSYVFTPSIKENISDMLENMGDGHGGGYWILSEYGGGKTHFLATVACLLSSSNEVRHRIDDEDVQQDMRLVQDRKLFPVALSLIGRASVIGKRNALYEIIENETSAAVREHLGTSLAVTLPEEIEEWWDKLDSTIRDRIAEKCHELCREPLEQVRQDSAERWVQSILDSTAALDIQVPLRGSPRDRLRHIYRQIVNPETSYTGILLIVDEFGSWQDRHPEGSPAYTEDEDLLQTLAEALPREEGLAIFTLVASQKPMPRKFQGGRFREVNVLRTSDEDGRSSREYEMVVAKRVRELDEFHLPEIQEYYQHYRKRFTFARDLSSDDFLIIFPVQPLCFDMLRRITASLSTARVGINVLWEVLGQETESGPTLRSRLLSMQRMITASDLLEAESLREALQSVRYVDAYRAYTQAVEAIDRLDMDPQDELPLARAVVRTMFLWHIARSGQVPMRLNDIAEAVVAEEGMFDNVEDAVLNVVSLMDDLPQLQYDRERKEFTFRADVISGRPASEIFDQYQQRFTDNHQLELRWREYLVNQAVSDGQQSALFGRLQTGSPLKTTNPYRGIEYGGEEIAVTDWYGGLGHRLGFDQHFRIVYLLQNATVTPDALQDPRIAVCIPADFSDQYRDAVRSLLAIDQMADDYRHRQDDEALRVQQFVGRRRQELVSTLLNVQRDAYRKGTVVSRDSVAIDPGAVFGRVDGQSFLLENLFAEVFKHRPIGAFRRNTTLNMSTHIGYIFKGLFERSPTGRISDALDNFAVGLGLALQQNPRRLDPSACGAFQLIQELYRGAVQQDQNLPANTIYEAFARQGIPARLATLYLLCFVRKADEGVELMLRDGHRLRLHNGAAPQGNRLTASLVRDVNWDNRWAGDDALSTFDVLAPRTGRSWNDALPWTRKVHPDLKTATEPADVEHQQALLQQALTTFAMKVTEASRDIERLCQVLGGQLPEDLHTALDQVKVLGTAQTYEELADRAEETFEHADAFGEALTKVNQLHDLARSAAAVAAAYTYLKDVPQGRLDRPLELDRTSLVAEMDLVSLAAASHKWPSLEHRFQAWRERYQIVYARFHRDYYVQMEQASRKLPQANRKLTALDHLEQVPGLASDRLASDLRNRLQAISGRSQACQIDVRALNLEAHPHCTQCSVRIGDPLETDVDALLEQVERRLEELLNNFSREAIRKLLEQSDQPDIHDLVQAINVSDRERIVDFLQSPESVTLIKGAIEGKKVSPPIRVNVTSKLAAQFPTVTREQQQKVVGRFSELLDEALTEAEKETSPGIEVEVQLQ